MAIKHSSIISRLKKENSRLRNEVAILQQQYAHERVERLRFEDREGRWKAEALLKPKAGRRHGLERLLGPLKTYS